MRFTFTKVFIASILALLGLLGSAMPLDLIVWGSVYEVTDTAAVALTAIAFALLCWAGRDTFAGLLDVPIYSSDHETPATVDAGTYHQQWSGPFLFPCMCAYDCSGLYG